MAVDKESLRQDIFAIMNTLLTDNKPSFTAPDNSTQTYSIVSAFPEKNSDFPTIIINESNVNLIPLTMEGSTLDFEVEVKLEFYALAKHGKKAIDVARDSVMNTFINNISTFISDDNLIPQEEFWTDESGTIFEDKNQIINSAESTVRFMVN